MRERLTKRPAPYISLMVLVLLMGALPCVGSSSTDRKSQNLQLAVIRDCVSTIKQNAAPSVADFLRIFGEDNEAELSMQLHEQFPAMNLSGDWFNEPKAKSLADDLMKNPGKHESVFLKCVRAKAHIIATLDVKTIGRMESKESLRRYNAKVGSGAVVFEFSEADTVLENVYVASGESIYDICR